jgi:6-phosphogluconolactonase
VLASEGAALVARGLVEAIETHGHAVLGLVGGTSVAPLYDALADQDVPWARVHILPLDERVVPADDPDRNWHVIERLTAPLVSAEALPVANLHPLHDGEPHHAADAMTSTLERLGGCVHVLVLSAGEDGHVASLFPGHPALRDEHVRFFVVPDSPKPPPRRVTASLPLLRQASTALVLAVGEAKRHALDRILAGTDEVTCPARIVHAIPDGHVLTDLDV